MRRNADGLATIVAAVRPAPPQSHRSPSTNETPATGDRCPPDASVGSAHTIFPWWCRRESTTNSLGLRTQRRPHPHRRRPRTALDRNGTGAAPVATRCPCQARSAATASPSDYPRPRGGPSVHPWPVQSCGVPIACLARVDSEPSRSSAFPPRPDRDSAGGGKRDVGPSPGLLPVEDDRPEQARDRNYQRCNGPESRRGVWSRRPVADRKSPRTGNGARPR